MYLAVASAAPVLAWLSGYPRRPWNDELSSAAAMVAFAMLLMEFATTGRIRFITDRLQHDLTMHWHRITGIVIVVIAFLHPYFYTQQDSSPQVDDPTQLLHLGLTGTSLITGISGLVLLLAMVVLAVFRGSLNYRYETWRIGHAVGAIVVISLLMTHVLIAGRFSQIETIRWLWIGLAVFAAMAMIYTFVAVPLMMSKRPYRLASREQKRKGEWLLTFAPMGFPLPPFRHGQCVWLCFNSSFAILEHPFSVPADQSNDGGVTFAIHERGDWTKQVGQIPIGATAYLNGPYG